MFDVRVLKLSHLLQLITTDRELGMPVPQMNLVFLTGEAYRRLRSNHTLNSF